MAWKDEARPYGPVKLAHGWTVEVDPNVCIEQLLAPQSL